MINKSCRVCHQRENLKPLFAKDLFLGSKIEYEYVHCQNCNSLSLTKIPENLPNLYSNYYSFSSSNKVSKIKLKIYDYIINHSNPISRMLCLLLKKQEDLPIKSLECIKLQKNSKILDVGCGSGTFLDLLYRMGFKNCTGIDPFLKNDITLSAGLKIKKQEFLELNDEFDLIMFHHVFEHVENPQEILAHIHKLLSRDGICIIRLPDVDSYSFLRYRESWFSIHAPFHVFLPSRKGMQMLIKNAGLILEKFAGEQLLEFFFYSMGHQLGITDYEKYGTRKFVEEYGIKKIPPLFTQSELHQAKQRLRQVKKHDLCDWAIYYIKKSVK